MKPRPRSERHAENLEVVGADEGGERATGFGALADADEREVLREDAGEEIAAFAQLTVGGVGERPEVGRLLFVLGEELDDPVGRGKRPRTEGERVDGAEHRGVQPDAEREGEHGHGGEAGVLQQLAEGEFQIVHGSLNR